MLLPTHYMLRHALTNSPRPPGQVKAVQRIAPPPQVSTDCAHPPVFQISTSPTTDRTTRKGNHFGNGFGDVGQPVGAGLVRVGVSWGWGWVCGDGDGDGDGEGMGLVMGMGMTAVMGMW
jgi:hypothetical protein